jgi:hypothetical protein
MANVHIEARSKGLPHGSRVQDYVVEDRADHVLRTFKTQREAIDWAHRQRHLDRPYKRSRSPGARVSHVITLMRSRSE